MSAVLPMKIKHKSGRKYLTTIISQILYDQLPDSIRLDLIETYLGLVYYYEHTAHL